jgi:hypothetical protein
MTCNHASAIKRKAREQQSQPLLKPAFYREKWWTWGGSNPRPHRCERCALPTELHAHCAFYSNKPPESRQTRGAASFRRASDWQTKQITCAPLRVPCGVPFASAQFSRSPGIFGPARGCVQPDANESLPSKSILCRRRARWPPPG